MHRTALTLGTAAILAKEFGHRAIARVTTSQLITMISVSSDDHVIGGDGGFDTGTDGLLTRVQVTEATNLSLLVLQIGGQLKSSDQCHKFVHLQQFLLGGSRVVVWTSEGFTEFILWSVDREGSFLKTGWREFILLDVCVLVDGGVLANKTTQNELQ